MILGFQIKLLDKRDSIYGEGDDLRMCPFVEESQIYSG